MKLLNLIKGLWLMFFSTKIFHPEDIFKGKRVAVIGPADSAYEKENGKYIDEFDYIIRINKAAQSWTEEKSKYIGVRTDILYHSFFENNESGGGKLDLNLFKNLGINYLINPRTNFHAYRRTYNFYRKYRKEFPVYHLPNSYYKKMTIPFGNLRPTVGFTALYSVLNSGCGTVFITGFTFFKTPYAKGYRDQLIDLEENKKHFKEQGIHDADLEFNLFKKLLENHNCSTIQLDNKLQSILNNYEKN